MPTKKITPHKGGRTEQRLILMTPEVKEMTDYVLAEMSRRLGWKVSLSDLWEYRVRFNYDYLMTHPDGMPPAYQKMTKIHTGKLTLPDDLQGPPKPKPPSSE